MQWMAACTARSLCWLAGCWQKMRCCMWWMTYMCYCRRRADLSGLSVRLFDDVCMHALFIVRVSWTCDETSHDEARMEMWLAAACTRWCLFVCIENNVNCLPCVLLYYIYNWLYVLKYKEQYIFINILFFAKLSGRAIAWTIMKFFGSFVRREKRNRNK